MKLLQELANQSNLSQADGSDAGTSDVQNKGAEVKFDLMRNTINSDGKVKGSDVANYLERAHELNDEVETVLYGLETSDGEVVKVYVDARQSDAFEAEMKKMLGMEDDIEEAINTLAAKFDIVDVIWPKGASPEGEKSDEGEVDLDDAADIGNPDDTEPDDDMETIASLDDEERVDAAQADDEPVEGEDDLPDYEAKDKKDKKDEKPKKDGEDDEAPADDEAPPEDEAEAEDEAPADDKKKDDKKEKKKGDKHSLLKSIGGGLAGKDKVAEGHVAWPTDEKTQSFKVTYFDPKYQETRTATIKAKNKAAAEDFCAGKGYDVKKMELVAEGQVVKADFSKGKGVDNPGIEVPKGYDRFEAEGKVIYGYKGSKKHVVSTTTSDVLARELVKVYNGGKASTSIKPMSMLQAFGSTDMIAADAAGVQLTEKPSYWEDFEGDGYAAKRNLTDLTLKKLENAVGKLKVYAGKDIYGISGKPRGPQATVKEMPAETMFVVAFSDGTRYVADQTGARTYIRNWQKIN